MSDQPLHPDKPVGGLVESVRPGSLAADAGIRAGERVLSVNSRPVRDVVDYQFEAAEEHVDLLIQQDGDRRLVPLDKHPDEDIGLAFEDATFDGTRLCNNTCFFCFLKGLPKGLRRTMYVKDDDYRLSFLHGNFVTLTNLTEDDWSRLEEQRLSPLNVSVHATELELRRRMLGNSEAPDIIEQLRRLGSIGIRAQTQVVLCPGVNDGQHLERTIEELASLFPTVQAVSVVPVGASIQYAERMAAVGKDGVDSLSPEYANGIIQASRDWQRRFRRTLGVTFCYLSDEFYLSAAAPVPAARQYDGFPQYENGVGMTRTLLDDWNRERRRLQRQPFESEVEHLTLACGELIAPTLDRLAKELGAAIKMRVDVVPVRNSLFGESIRVSGLLGAGDFIGALRQAPRGEVIFLPRSSLDYFGQRFLDDGTPADVERVLERPIGFASTLSEVLDQLRGSAIDGGFPAQTNRASNGRFWAIDTTASGRLIQRPASG